MGVIYQLQWVFWVLVVLVAVILLISSRVILAKQVSRRRFRRQNTLLTHLLTTVAAGDTTVLMRELKRRPIETMTWIANVFDDVSLPEVTQETIFELFRSAGVARQLSLYVHSWRPRHRMAAARLIRVFPEAEIVNEVADLIQEEKSRFVAFSMWYSLLILDDPRVLHILATAESRHSTSYMANAFRTLENAGPRIRAAAVTWIDDPNPVARRMVLHLSAGVATGPLREQLLASLSDDDTEIRRVAYEIARRHAPRELIEHHLPDDPDVACRAEVARAFASIAPDPERLDRILADEPVREGAFPIIAESLSRFPSVIPILYERFHGCDDPALRDAYARLLHVRSQYVLNRNLTTDPAGVGRLIERWVAQGQYAQTVDFINSTRIEETRHRAIEAIRPVIPQYPEFRDYCARYLAADPARELGLPPAPEPTSRERIPLTARDKRILAYLMVAAILFFPTLYVVRFWHTFPGMNAGYIFRHFLIQYNYMFAAYAIMLNLSYLVLLYFSGVELRKQSELWLLRDERFLFESRVLPGVTVLAPAYNEEATVVESVRSLLTLRYPDYGVVVINDGSRDGTLGALIDAFGLERVDSIATSGIRTAPVRGTYRSQRVPRLLVIDKENGGKADALNVGINYAAGDYICCIDSDSLLERDALLAIAYPTITDSREVVAVGGNILPVNGCTVSHGSITDIHPPRSSLGVLQTIEYLRSFIAGRLGWAHLDSLLVISGAFGLFKRDRVLEIGGYLTGEGAYRRDTVGEDMELVVRLVDHMTGAGQPFAVRYAYNANCWTEVPERWESLLRQRDRWHRGLIEIMTYHKRMIGSRRHGKVGLIALPYLVLFELIGPFFEIIGFAVVALCLFFGLLSLRIVAILFGATVLLGVMVSLSSLFFSEKGVLFFKGKDFARVFWAAITENFGRRQLLSAKRSIAYATYLVRNVGWQHLTRRGFSQPGGHQ